MEFAMLTDVNLRKSGIIKYEIGSSIAPPRLPSWKYMADDELKWTKFSSLMQNELPSTMIWSKSKPEVEFQYGGQLFLQTGSSYISVVD